MWPATTSPEPARSARIPGRRARVWTRVLREAWLLGAALAGYELVRYAARDAASRGAQNAARVVRLEKALHIAREVDLQHAFLETPRLVRMLDWVYIFGYWPVLAATLTYLLLAHPRAYRRLRTALIVSGTAGLLLFVTFPLTPPRLAATGALDTVAVFDARYEQAARPGRFTNAHAAMPSFHFGWDLLCGIGVASTLRRRRWRMVSTAAPLVMALAIVVTGNHYFVDAVVGGVLVLVGLAVGAWLHPVAVAVRGPLAPREGGTTSHDAHAPCGLPDHRAAALPAHPGILARRSRDGRVDRRRRAAQSPQAQVVRGRRPGASGGRRGHGQSSLAREQTGPEARSRPG